MFTEFPRILTGDKSDCSRATSHVLIHATKTCHRQIIGQPHPQDPDYLHAFSNGELYLNMIDPPLPLFRLEMFITFLDFALPRYRAGQSLLIHCDQGESRSRSLALLLASHLHLLPTDNFYAAAAAFEEHTGRPYTPGQGIVTFLDQQWNRLVEYCPL